MLWAKIDSASHSCTDVLTRDFQTFDTFENSLGIENRYRKILYRGDLTVGWVLVNISPRNNFHKIHWSKDITKIFRMYMGATGMKGLKSDV